MRLSWVMRVHATQGMTGRSTKGRRRVTGNRSGRYFDQGGADHSKIVEVIYTNIAAS